MKLLSLLYGPQELGQTFLRYLPPIINSYKKVSLKKIINAVHAEYERRIKKVVLSSHPFILHIELTNVCNLKCPYCITGSDTNNLHKGFLRFDSYKKIIDDLKDYLVLVRLDGVGESFLNKDFFKMVEYATQNKIITAVSTNFVAISKEDTEKLINAGLDYLIVGIDGASQEVYQKIRPGGSIEKIKENLEYLIAKKKERNSKTPLIETQFITFDENYQESEQVKKLSAELGADRHLIKDLRELPVNVAKHKAHKTKSCYWLWYVANVNWLGDLKACCLVGLDSEFSFGNIIDNHISEEWNSDKLQKIRKLFIAKDAKTMEELKGCICLDCYKLVDINQV